MENRNERGFMPLEQLLMSISKNKDSKADVMQFFVDMCLCLYRTKKTLISLPTTMMKSLLIHQLMWESKIFN